MKRTLFEEIVTTLSNSEKQEMLGRLKLSLDVEETPLREIEEKAEKIDLEKTYHSYNIFHRFFLFIASIFTGRTVLDVVEDHLVKVNSDAISRQAPGLVDFQASTFEPKMHKHIANIRDHFIIFKDALSFGLNNKGDFYAFLGSFFLPEVHQRLMREGDPWETEKNNQEKEPKYIKAVVETNIDRVFSELSADNRSKMYHYARILQILNQLAQFNWEKLTNPFMIGHQDYVSPCPVGELREGLEDLADILHSFTLPPSTSLIEALFLFNSKENLKAEEDQLEEYLTSKVSKGLEALNALRDFNKNVPIRLILQYILGNINYYPEEVPGGEDWFALYRKFWQERCKKLNAIFLSDKEKEKLAEEVVSFLGNESIPPIFEYDRNFLNTGLKGRFAFSLAVVRKWYSYILMKQLNSIFKKILVEGEFYKKENKEDFTDSYNNLLLINGKISSFCDLFEPEQEYGEALSSIEKNEESVKQKYTAVSDLLADIDRRATDIVRDTVQTLSLMSQVLKGIVYGEFGGRYDTLSNISHITHGGKGNFRQQVDGALRMVEMSLRIIDNINNIEVNKM